MPTPTVTPVRAAESRCKAAVEALIAACLPPDPPPGSFDEWIEWYLAQAEAREALLCRVREYGHACADEAAGD